MPKSFLIDTSRCTACRGCQIACKEWKGFPAVHTLQKGTHQNPPDLGPYNFKLVRFKEYKMKTRVEWLFFPEQCRHCLEPGCKAGADAIMCRDRLFAAGKRCLHLLDLIFPSPADDPAGEPGPGYSGRQEARAALKVRLLSTIWNENLTEPERGPVIVMSPEVEAQLEDRRILAQDVRRTLATALATGRFLRDGHSGRILASLRPRRVTFWAEFQPDDGGHRLLRAYSHRMENIVDFILKFSLGGIKSLQDSRQQRLQA